MMKTMKSTLALRLIILSSLFFIPLNLTAKPSCKTGKEIVSCQIQGGGSFSVCRVNKHKVLYKFLGKGKRKPINRYSAPYYSREKYKTALYETLRINNKNYDYVINTAHVTNYNDKRRRKVRVAWLDVYKNKQKLAKLTCADKKTIMKTRGLKLIKDNLASYRDTRLYTEKEYQALAKKIKQQNKQQKAMQRKGYAVQLVSTSSKRKARKIQKVFKQEGYKSYIAKTTQSRKTMYHVRVGVYEDKQLAQQVQQGMKKRYKRNSYVKKSQVVANKG